MNRTELMSVVESQMPQHRWEHTLGVVETAINLSIRFGANKEQAELAAIIHDYAKYWPSEALRQVIEREQPASDLLAYDEQLWHAPVGAIMAKQELGIEDETVLNAVRYHTSGRPNMSLLEKIICVADYIEPGRSFPGVDDIRKLAKHDIDAALIVCFDSTIRFLLQKGKKIYPLTIAARNDLL